MTRALTMSFTNPKDLGAVTTVDAEEQQIAASGNNVYVVWREPPTPQSMANEGDIFFRRSTDGGKNFDSPENLSNNPGHSEMPQIAASGNNVYVVWQDSTPGNAEIFFRRSTDKGNNFDSTKNLSNNPEDSFDPQLRTSGNKVYVVWRDFSTAGAGFNTYFIRSK
jgi:hypothetical protein